MLEKDCIQTRGFHNFTEQGEVSGFCLNVRSLYYRGLWLSQLRPATVIVDGETYSGDQIRWQVNGKVYGQDEMLSIGDEHWCVTEPATLIIKRPGGLASGYHDVGLSFRFSSSYLPPSMDEVLSYGDHQRRMILV